MANNGSQLDNKQLQLCNTTLTDLVTGNPFKIAEFGRYLGSDLRIRDIPNVLEAQPELHLMKDGRYSDCSIHVARAKARDARLKNGNAPCLVEDTALYCDGLEGMPGPLIKYNAHNESALQRLCRDIYCPVDGTPPVTSAVWIVALAAWNGTDDEPQCWLGEIHGIISPELRGPAKFGFDPVFIPQGSSETLAELVQRDPTNKDQYSARRLAIENMKKLPFRPSSLPF